MAIALDSADGGLFNNAGSTTTFTLSHTCTGSNLVLVVPLYVYVGTTISSVTYNGTAMTKASSVLTASNNFDSYIYILTAPSTGANNIVVTTSANIAGNKQIGFKGLSYTGCAQTGQPDSSNSTLSAGNSGASFTVSTTVVASNCWLVGGAETSIGGMGDAAAGAGTTYRNPKAGNISFADSNGTVGTGSQSLIWGRDDTGTGDDTGSILSLAPAATTNIKSLNGLAYASIKSRNGLAMASVKNVNGLA